MARLAKPRRIEGKEEVVDKIADRDIARNGPRFQFPPEHCAAVFPRIIGAAVFPRIIGAAVFPRIIGAAVFPRIH
jgi:hypothetical protein